MQFVIRHRKLACAYDMASIVCFLNLSRTHMSKNLSFAPIAMLVAATFHMLPAATVSAQPLTYPITKKIDHVDSYHGEKIADPYRWLEDDNSAETKAWVAAQNAVSSKYLQALPNRDKIQARYTALYNFEKFGLPVKEGGRYFWTRNDGLQQQSVLYVSDSLQGTPRVLIDPNSMSKDGTFALTSTSVSRDGKYILYGSSTAGSDWTDYRVRDIDTGADLPDFIQWVKFSRAEWSPDSKGFFYGAYAAPKAGEKLTGTNFFQKAYYHRLGAKRSQPIVVYERPDQKDWSFSALVSEDKALLLIHVSRAAEDKNGLLWAPMDKDGGFTGAKFNELTLDFEAEYSVIGSRDKTLWIKTNFGAPRGRVMQIDLNKPAKSDWKIIVPESARTLEDASIVGNTLIVQYLKDARSEVQRFSLDGKFLGEVALPGVGTVTGFAGKAADPETFFTFTSLTEPSALYHYDVVKNAVNVWRKPKTAFDSSQFESKQVFVASKDGTKIPVFIGHKKGIKLDGNNASYLTAYGGFNISRTPAYSVTAGAWMEMGGVFVLASIRGGGEYGKAWHEAAKGDKRQNAYDDFIAVAQWLTANGYSRPEKIGAIGGSNGGLLVGAVVNQRPEIFGAAIPEVGVMDMLRFHKFTIGWAWVPEFGSSDQAADFAHLKRISPLHNIKNGAKYPPMMVMTSDHDDRVVPAHSFKYAAALQAADTGSAAKIIRIETSAGHGAGSPTSKIIDGRTDVLAFFANALGLGK
jgi:prolyl oligopeptidase